MHAALSLLIALVVKLKVSRTEAEVAAGGGAGRRGGSAALRGRPAAAGGRGAAGVGCGAGAAEWIPSAGNVAAVGALALALQVTSRVDSGRDR